MLKYLKTYNCRRRKVNKLFSIILDLKIHLIISYYLRKRAKNNFFKRKDFTQILEREKRFMKVIKDRTNKDTKIYKRLERDLSFGSKDADK
mmetsp:Transcript_15145/g.13290  ORF Transcript_15145/g.13290 Transcript_15145/m.13290 type:complete len:91 (+) Transcript_15145:536-808(+)